jgi:hypothetical protein
MIVGSTVGVPARRLKIGGVVVVLAQVGRLAPLPVRPPHHQLAVLEAQLEQHLAGVEAHHRGGLLEQLDEPRLLVLAGHRSLGGAPALDEPGRRVVEPGEIPRCP